MLVESETYEKALGIIEE